MQEVLEDFERFFARLCAHIGEDRAREGLEETPKRIIESFQTLFSGYAQNPTCLTLTAPCSTPVRA